MAFGRETIKTERFGDDRSAAGLVRQKASGARGREPCPGQVHTRSGLVSPKPSEERGPTPKPALGSGPHGVVAPRRAAPRREPGDGTASAGRARACGSVPGVPRKGFALPPPHPWLCVLWPWEARRTEGRNPPCRRERGRTIYSCAGEGGTGRFSREKSENESCAGGLPAPEGIKHHQPLKKKKKKILRTNLKPTAGRILRSLAPAAAPPAPTRGRLPPLALVATVPPGSGPGDLVVVVVVLGKGCPGKCSDRWCSRSPVIIIIIIYYY